ncbi:hypothetical protein QCA50_017301 [Cerrena zonata]|uniref:Uncharacterized protein n=1 Tax=Cerrena zonata TaxID=2478898 RepID=A0AAW0FDH6_9APHY
MFDWTCTSDIPLWVCTSKISKLNQRDDFPMIAVHIDHSFGHPNYPPSTAFYSMKQALRRSDNPVAVIGYLGCGTDAKTHKGEYPRPQRIVDLQFCSLLQRVHARYVFVCSKF